jgi:hypothetical protein
MDLEISLSMKHKVFLWLFLKDRLNTRGLLRRKHMQLDSYTYEMCLLQKVESVRHFHKMFFRKELLAQYWGPCTHLA